jgi:hypothetical protein
MKVEEINNPQLYNKIQAECMNIYIDFLRKSGDTRDKNLICIEWISLYSVSFRKTWNESQ